MPFMIEKGSTLIPLLDHKCLLIKQYISKGNKENKVGEINENIENFKK